MALVCMTCAQCMIGKDAVVGVVYLSVGHCVVVCGRYNYTSTIYDIASLETSRSLSERTPGQVPM